MKAAMPSGVSLESYKPKFETFIELSGKYSDKELNAILDNLVKAPNQYRLLSSYIRLSGYKSGARIIPVKKSLLLSESGPSANGITALITKGFLSRCLLQVQGLILMRVTRNQ